MGSWYIIVNPAKRQYIDPSSFGEGFTRSNILSGYHSVAVTCLVCDVDEIGSLAPPAGTWAGDPVIVTGDESHPGGHGIETATPESPDRNLYHLAGREYDDISYQCLIMLANWRPWILENLAARAAEEEAAQAAAEGAGDRFSGGYRILFHLGNIVDMDRDGQVESALRKHVGENWRERHERYRLDRLR